MAYTSGTYSQNEDIAFDYLVNTMKLNVAAACGVLSNIYYESSFNPNSSGDEGTSYGICQWHLGNFTRLKTWCNSAGLSYTSIQGQLAFLKYDLYEYDGLPAHQKYLVTTYLKGAENSAEGAYLAAAHFCARYEVPVNYGSWEGGSLTLGSASRFRGAEARDKFWEYWKDRSPSTSANIMGKKVVAAARKKLGKPYKSGKSGPDEFDGPGLVYWSYKSAGYTGMQYMSAQKYYDYYTDYSAEESKKSGSTLNSTYKASGKSIKSDAVSAGDLLFYSPRNKITQIAIATGEGGRIHSKSTSSSGIAGDKTGVVEESGLGDPMYILRILSDTQTTKEEGDKLPSTGTGSGSTGSDSGSESTPSSSVNEVYEDLVEDFTALSTIDPYNAYISENLSRVSAEGFDYGYLIDLTHGGVFKFYVPEFSESAGANWESINIPGRSVTILSYGNTNSRSIEVSLHLYAGEGLYKGDANSDVVGKLHKDVNFLKSLEYPDYSNPIVRPPSTVQLVLGSSIKLVGVVSSVNVEHQKPTDSQNRSMYLRVSFTVTQTAVNPPDYSDIREGNYTLLSTSDVSSLSNTSALISLSSTSSATASQDQELIKGVIYD